MPEIEDARLDNLREPATRLLEQVVTAPVTVLNIAEADRLDQGYSGGEVRAYRVTYRTADGPSKTLDLVCKQAVPREQQVIRLLAAQGQAIPPAYQPQWNASGRAPVYMLFAKAHPPDQRLGDPHRPFTARVAKALAGIHAANRGQCPPWLPRVQDDVLHELYLQATQSEWQTCLQDNAFAAQFGQYTESLHRALDHLLALLDDLTSEADTLTLINSDLHPDHIRLLDDETPVLIDWEQACYGSLYLDLANYFTVETVLLYRDALAEAGYAIPPAAFIERFRTVGHFMGLRYLEVGLQAWRAGGELWRQQRWFFHYCLTLALRGR